MSTLYCLTAKHLVVPLCCLLLSAPGLRAAEPSLSLRTYAVNRPVSAFPTNEDLSTPEAAYATICRAWRAEGLAAFARLSIPELAGRIPAEPQRPAQVKEAAAWLAAEVVEVELFQETNAVVLARLQGGGKERIDLRWLQLDHARWLNTGNDRTATLEEGRRQVVRGFSYEAAKSKLASRPPIANPQEYLRPFVEFLRREAAEPQAFLLQALARNQVVILGEVHHRPRYWAFNRALVQTRAFAERAGVIYLELPSNDQGLVEQFLAAPRYEPQPIIEMLRDNLWTGWPDQPMLDFFQAVWQANQALPAEQRLRLVLVDMQRPWKQITRREQWKQYDVNRDQFMADNIERDLRAHPADRRHALFIVGYAHAMVNLSKPDGAPMKSAGWHLREQLGATNVFAVFPHSPVLSNMGELRGRIALGLFETAFAALTNRPMAFPLDHGPFGEQLFDASMDHLTVDPFRNGYQAYLYLGPLEEERFSPLIPGFYTDEFARELDRRHRLLFGKGLESAGIKRVDGESVIRWMSQSWGQPRAEWSAKRLGPLRAWEGGSHWEEQDLAAKLDHWAQDKPAIRQAAQRLFDALRQVDYSHPGNWRSFPAPDVDYTVATDGPAWQRWVCGHFRTNPMVAVELGEVAQHTNGLPAVPYQVRLQNGETLAGLLPLRWHAYRQKWDGVEGVDWHLKTRP